MIPGHFSFFNNCIVFAYTKTVVRKFNNKILEDGPFYSVNEPNAEIKRLHSDYSGQSLASNKRLLACLKLLSEQIKMLERLWSKREIDSLQSLITELAEYIRQVKVAKTLKTVL